MNPSKEQVDKAVADAIGHHQECSNPQVPIVESAYKQGFREGYQAALRRSQIDSTFVTNPITK